MPKQTLTRADIVQKISSEIGISAPESAEILETVLHNIIDSLAKTGKVKFSSFGGFEVKRQAERMGCNPRTGEAALIKERNTVKFRPSLQMKKTINDAYKRQQ